MELLSARWKKELRLCVGLDSEASKIPKCVESETHTVGLMSQASKIAHFNRSIVEATHMHVCAFKPNSAFYEAIGRNGADCALDATVAQINAEAPDVPVILDVKRGDIGNTAKQYAIAAFDRHKADAVTVNPYMGEDALAPFTEREDKGVFILCRTSNPSAIDLQDCRVSVRRDTIGILIDDDGKADLLAHSLGWVIPGYGAYYAPPYYQYVALLASCKWNKNGNVGLVVGATVPDQLAAVRQIVGPDMPILVPGVGSQGGDLEAVLKAGGDNIIINSSRGIIFASNGDDYAERAGEEAVKLASVIRMLSGVSVH